MKLLKLCLTGGFLLAALVGLQGCASNGAGGSSATAVGTGYYSDSEFHVMQGVALDKVWEAAKSAVKEMQSTVLTDRTLKNDKEGILTILSPEGQLVVIKIHSVSQRMTEIRIRVAASNSAANRSAAELIYKKMKFRM